MITFNPLCTIFNTLKTWGCCTRVEEATLINMISWSAVIDALVICFILIIVLLFYKIKHIARRSLFPPFALVWFLGFIVYDIGMYTGERWSLLGNAPMAIIYAFGMFVLNSDVSAIHDFFSNSGWFMLGFSLVHFMAALISLAFVLKHFGFNIIENIKRFAAKFWRPKDTTYLFWGMSNATYHLAKSINSHYKGSKDSYRIIIVRSSNDVNVSNSKNGLGRLFNFLSSNDNDIERITSIQNCLTANTFVNISELDVHTGNSSHDVFGALGLHSISKLIDKKTNGNVHVFFLSGDEAANINAVNNMEKDSTLWKVLGSVAKTKGKELKDENGKAIKRQVKFYCHARHNSINRVIEDFDVTNNIEVRIVDTSHLSIECLKRDVRLQPISFVDIDKEKNYGTVTSPFTSLVVGFGETGKDALRFLYEFGAFVDSDNTKGTHRSPFCCHIVDKRLDTIIGPFRNASPQVFLSKDDSSPSVVLHPIDYDSDDFYYRLLNELSLKLNYIVIAIGNDEAGMTLAVRILKYLRRQGRDFKKLRILVRSYESSLYPYMDKIAKHYNEGEERIVLFGHEEQLYTYNMIVEDEFELRGKDYYESYRSLNPEHDEDGSWNQRRKKLKGLITLQKKQIDPKTGCPIFEETIVDTPRQTSLNNLQKLRRKETQDKNNALHEATKMKILETIIPNWYSQLVPCIFDFVNTGDHIIVRNKRKHLFNNNPKEVQYTDLESKEQLLMDNLAKLEHLRWNASHELLGYTPMPSSVPNEERGCDEAKVTHNCLVDWEDLDVESDRISYINDYKIFDYGVVETTIDIYRRAKEKKELNNE